MKSRSLNCPSRWPKPRSIEWKKKPGELVQIDEILVEIETDKVVLEVPAPAAGVMAQLVKNDGEQCVSGEVIAKIDTEGAEAVSPLPVKPVPVTTPPADAPAAAPRRPLADRSPMWRCQPPPSCWPTTR